MNIGIITYWYERGASYVSKHFEKALSVRHNVFIYARGGEKHAVGDPNWDHPNVYWSKSEPRYYRTYINQKELAAWIKKNSIEAVIFNEQDFFEPILWCNEMGVKTLAYIDYYKENTIPLFEAYDGLICNTKRHCNAFDIYDTVHYLPWGTDTSLYQPLSEDIDLVEDGKIIFFNSAGMSPERKGTDIFIKALDLCSTIPSIRGLVHSQKNLKKYMPELADVVDRLVAKGVLKVVEKTIPAPGLYTKADVYVYPSRLDGIGLTIAEAISSGLVCVVSDNPPMNEFVTPDFGDVIPVDRLFARSDGYYWPQCRCNAEKLAEIMKEYATHPEKVKAMKQKAREYALEHLSADKNFMGLIDIVDNIKSHTIADETKKAIYLYDREGMKRYTLSYANSGIYKMIPYKLRFRKYYKKTL